MGTTGIALSVKKLSKSFRLPHEKGQGIKQAVVNIFSRTRGYEVQHVLNDIDFSIKKGEFFGIVGRNGSGKSKLLKLIAGIYTPDSGAVQVNGSLTPFIELGVGFNPELTGRENVFLNGALLGFSRQEMEGMYDDIVSFAELERFMDQRLKNYSSGMQVRLAFSIAIRAQSDILLLDEVLAVGDEAFQKKCFEYFAELKRTKRTVILVTHDMSNVEKFCDRALVVDKGRQLGICMPAEAKILYEQLNAAETKDEASENVLVDKRWGSKEATITSTWVESEGESKKNVVKQGVPFTLHINISSEKKIPIIVGFAIENEYGDNFTGPNSGHIPMEAPCDITYEVARLPINPGKYRVRVVLFNEDSSEEYDHIEDAILFEVIPNKKITQVYGKMNLFGEWKRVGRQVAKKKE